MESMNSPTDPVPFPENEAAREFATYLSALVRDQVGMKLEHLVPSNNTERYYHGSGWSYQGESGNPSGGSFQLTEVSNSIGFDALVQHDLSLIPKFIESVVEELVEAMSTRIYEVLQQTTERTGNVVSAKESGSTAEAFLDMLRKIELRVGPAGKVELPQIHMHPDTASKVIAELQALGADFQGQVDSILREKTLTAVAKENERLGKFRTKPSNA
jgi:hypothetical protein